MSEIITMIPAGDASDMPEEVIEYCVGMEISTHYQNDIMWVDDDGNPMAEWLKENGLKFTDDHIHIGIFAT